ncbi:MAG: hypothetical protein JWM11_66 [Planctomycetaceae bacterium]|nr:hypothetical protein [Planctomycetaceae bacterium]
MGFIKRFLKNVFRDGQQQSRQSSFENLSEDQLEAHLQVSRYGDFTLTDAIRPSFDLQVMPQAGYRHDAYRDGETGVRIPVLMVSASKEQLFDLFLDLLDPLGTEVDVVLETSHDTSRKGHQDLYREHIDLPVLKSSLYDFEDMLLDDGCTGIAVLNPNIPLEVQFDEHKLLIMYGQDLSEFEAILEQAGIERMEDMKFITEAEHVHSSSDEFQRQFEQLQYRLGLDDE